MTKRWKRRIRNAAIFAILVIVAVNVERLLAVLHWRTPFVSGWVLIGLIVTLALYSFRKKLAFLPVGTSAGWLQFHIYAGLMTSVIFMLHVGWRIPNGIFESVLAATYLGTFFSGVLGLVLTRTLPARLTSRGEEVLFERIPIFLKALRDDVEQTVFECVEQTETTVISELYVKHLRRFFDRPRNALWHLLHSSRPRTQLLLLVEGHQRYLSEDEQHALSSITDRVRRKDDLDYQYALQGILKLWLFVHIPLTWSLLTMGVFHGLAVYAYGGLN